MRIFACMAGLLLFCGIGDASGTVISVLPDGSGDAPHIQAALEMAEDGDVIELGDGLFTGEGNFNIDFLGRAVTIRSASGTPGACVMSSPGAYEEERRAFWFHGGEGSDSVLEGIYFTDWHSPTWTPVGGVILIENASPTIRNCDFVDNSVQDAGGAIRSSTGSSPMITDCRFLGNYTVGWESVFGGAVSVASATILRCYFGGNLSGSAGAIAVGGAGDVTIIEDCKFVGNTAHYGSGGAIRVANNYSTSITRCTFYDNWAHDRGAAIFVSTEASISVEQCIVMNCEAAVLPVIYGDVSISCTDIYGNPGGDWVGTLAEHYGQNGNISLDPQFCGQPDGNYYLQSDSPCAPDNNDCGLQMGAFGQGCIDTPVLLAGFDAESEPGAITLRWELGAAAAAPDFRLEARQGESLRELDWRATDPGGFEARDELPADCAGEEISYSLFGRDGDEDWFPLGELSVIAPEQVLATRLLAPFPNPFNPKVTISFTLAEAGKVRVSIFDITGRRVARLADENFESGSHELVWTGRDNAGHVQSSGIYFLSMEASGYSERRRLVLLR